MKEIRNILIAAALLFASCDKGETPGRETRLTLAWQMEAQAARASIDNHWEDGQQVWVSIDNGASEIFTAASDGTLTPVRAIWWYSQMQTRTARGWYPDPASWSFPADQSGGLQAADFLFAPTVAGIKYNNCDSKPLVFRHLTARVTVNLSAGTDIASVSGAAVTFYGYTSGVPDTDNGLIAGSGDGSIIPRRTAGTDIYTALLIPRDMTGVKFIKVSLDGYDYFFTPASGQAALEQGKGYTYNITVDKTRLTVTATGNGAAWDASGNGAVEATPIPGP